VSDHISGQVGESVAVRDDRVERDILALLNKPGANGIWTVGEVQRELGGGLQVIDAMDRLCRAGIVHRCGDFVLLTRAAARSLQLAEF
jgi:hypothetical protein